MGDKLRRNSTKILLAVAQIVVAILLLINPVGFTAGIIIAAGVVAVAAGVISIVKYVKLPAIQAASEQRLARGIVLIAVGVFAICKYGWFIGVFSILAALYGLGILLSSIARVQWTVDMLRVNHPRWWLMAIDAVITALLGILILTNPFAAVTVPWLFVSIALFVGAAIDIVYVVMDVRN